MWYLEVIIKDNNKVNAININIFFGTYWELIELKTKGHFQLFSKKFWLKSPLAAATATAAGRGKIKCLTASWLQCYYPHRSRDSLSPVCGIFLNPNRFLLFLPVCFLLSLQLCSAVWSVSDTSLAQFPAITVTPI